MRDDEPEKVTVPSAPAPRSTTGATPPTAPAQDPPARQVRADADDTTLVVYQAYAPEIAEPALAAGTFVTPFRRGRMTWVKPSFLWMMYRCGWATKPGQERVLAVRITRAGFEEALAEAALSHADPRVHADHAAWREQVRQSPVRVQWDPERSLTLAPLPWRSLQVGLSGSAVDRYVDEWVTGITDVTPTVRRVRGLLLDGDVDAATAALPVERPYPLPSAVAARIGADPGVTSPTS
ncbi:hypothetical protein CCE01nite_38700 [Cellulomonas cellasea]|uniref:DUF4291 domain-containing protein n=1 Tax=Cellulomonas cellasea TaxID=43670 RepID=A0A4Y3KZK7_9CELL|nr:hypothetical protein CCE01nite_38700 [Cellulomonas cellasea]